MYGADSGALCPRSDRSLAAVREVQVGRGAPRRSTCWIHEPMQRARPLHEIVSGPFVAQRQAGGGIRRHGMLQKRHCGGLGCDVSTRMQALHLAVDTLAAESDATTCDLVAPRRASLPAACTSDNPLAGSCVGKGPCPGFGRSDSRERWVGHVDNLGERDPAPQRRSWGGRTLGGAKSFWASCSLTAIRTATG